MDYIYKLAIDSFGICILKKIIDILATNITEIAQNPFGNYAITKALEVKNIYLLTFYL
jgi:hypothetical protein